MPKPVKISKDIGVFLRFCQETTTLHGLPQIAKKGRHPCERLLWLLIFILAVATATFMIATMWSNYIDSPIITVFSAEKVGVGNIPFPAVTICNTNKARKSIVEQRVREAQAWSSQGPNNDTIYFAQAAIVRIGAICRSTETFGDRIGTKKQSLEDFDRVREEIFHRRDFGFRKHIPKFIYVNQRCDEMIVYCLWMDEPVKCGLVFQAVLTDHGFCCTFNAIPFSLLRNFTQFLMINPKMYEVWKHAAITMDQLVVTKRTNQPSNTIGGQERPRRQTTSGQTGGLSILLDPDLDNYFCTTAESEGFVIGLSAPFDYPQLKDSGIPVRTNSEVFVGLRPQVTLTSTPVRSFKKEERGCYLEGEYKLTYHTKYTMSNCLAECIARMTVSKCGCLRIFMPKNVSENWCRPRNYSCTNQVRENMTSSAGLHVSCPQCLPTCTEIEYTTQVSTLRLQQKKIEDWLKAKGKIIKKPSIIHIYLNVDSTVPTLRTERYSLIDLISNTGALLCLCMGFSVISLVEVIFYFCIRPAHNHWKQRGQASTKTDTSWRFFRRKSKRGNGCGAFHERIVMNKNGRKSIQKLSHVTSKHDLHNWEDGLFGYLK